MTADSKCTAKRALLSLGMLLYIASFFLFAFGGGGGQPVRGYGAAILTVIIPWEQNPFSPLSIFHDSIFDYIAILISGLINPLFLISIALILLERQRAVDILRTTFLLMIPFCWVVFYFHHFYPREGYFVWLFGMVLVLFSSG
jgi:hypothetical protein